MAVDIRITNTAINIETDLDNILRIENASIQVSEHLNQYLRIDNCAIMVEYLDIADQYGPRVWMT